jgi:hypothetical protein
MATATPQLNTFGQDISKAGGSIVPTVPTATEPSVVSTTTARDAVQGAVKTLNGYTTNAANAQASKVATSMATNSANKNDASAEQPLSLIDPNTLQTIQFVSPSLNTDNIQSYLAKGYQVEGRVMAVELSTPTPLRKPSACHDGFTSPI